MKKGLIGLLIASFILVFSAGAMADLVYEPEDYSAIKAANSDIASAIRNEPTSLIDYAGIGLNMGTEILAKFLRTAKPSYVGKGGFGAQINLIEAGKWNLVGGLTFKTQVQQDKPDKAYLGLEREGIPWAEDIFGILKNLNIGVALFNREIVLLISFQILD